MISVDRLELHLALAARHANPFFVDVLITMCAMTDAAFLDCLLAIIIQPARCAFESFIFHSFSSSGLNMVGM
jgi:hypothetical protein